MSGDEGSQPVQKNMNGDEDESGQDEEGAEEQSGPISPDSGLDLKSAEQAAIVYATGMNEALPELKVLDSKIVGEWARVELEPVDKSADKATALLNYKGGQWEVVGFGFVLPADYPDVPGELFE
ncbi:MAG: hypothetical protein JW738_10315 [Actinobacteria bacterium]|nr:hypothetical protein [Actinomycetota bacterium]